MRRMDLGATVILDALGFKGIWAREDGREVLDRLKSFRRTGVRLQGKDHGGVLLCDSGLRHRVRCMSDTIIVTVVVKGPKAPKRGLYKAMLSASLIAGTIMLDAIERSPVLLFRGCLAAGEMNEEADFLIGPAVDEAAERYETADGPFLWMAPSALEISRLYAQTFLDRVEPVIMLPYPVPLNNGNIVQTNTFTYFQLSREADARAETRRCLLQAFGEDPLTPKVRAKKQNTALFLDYIEETMRDEGRMRDERIFRLPEWDDLSPSQRIKLLIRGIKWG